MTIELLRSLTLKVELFAGITIDEAASDLCQLSERVGVLCEANFNGVALWARPGDSPELLAVNYVKELRRPGNVHRIAQGR